MAKGSTSEPRTLVTHPELKAHQSFPFFKTVGEPPKSPLERLLSIFADVRAGEGVGALLLAVNVFLMLGLYSLLKPAGSGLIIAEGSAELKSYAAAAQAVLLMGVVPLYGWLASRVVRIRLITITSVFFALNLVLFHFAGRAGFHVGIAFYVWLGVFSVFVISQLWAFANDLYTEGQGRRLFPLIGVGASLGALVGATAVKPLLNRLQFTPYTLMLVAAVGLLVALGITFTVNYRETARADPDAARANETPLGREGGFELILKDNYLLWIAVLAVLLNVVNSTGNFMLDKLMELEAFKALGAEPAQEAARAVFITGLSSSIMSTVNLVGLLLQLFVTSRVMRFMGVRGALFILPVLALVNYSVIAVAAILPVVRIGKILENSTDYSIQNTIRQALFLPVSREAKYKAKAAIDTFFTRAGDVLSAGFVKASLFFNVGLPVLGMINVLLTVLWLFVAGQIAREHRRKTI